MNKIYKVVWSEARNCYVVVSELAKRKVRAKSLVAAVLAAGVLAAGAVDSAVTVYAAEKADNGISQEVIDEEDALLARGANVTARAVEGETKEGELKPYEQKAGQVHRDEDIAIGEGSEVNRVLQYHEATGKWKEDVSAGGVAVGHKASVLGGGSVAVGQNSFTIGTHSLAVGSAAGVYGTNSIAVGASAIVGSETNLIEGGISVGTKANVSAIHSIAIGSHSITNGVSAVSIGQLSNAAGSNAIAIGTLSKVEADSDNHPTEGIAIGSNAHTSGFQSAAIGPSSTAEGDYSEAFGSESHAVGDYSISVGAGTLAEGTKSTVVGYQGQASGYAATALGTESNASGGSSIAVGDQSTASGDYAITVGANSTASKFNSITMGYFSNSDGQNAISIGAYSGASNLNSIAFGVSSQASGSYSTAIGIRSNVSGDNSTAIGRESNVRGRQSIASGYKAQASGDNSTAIGRESNVSGSQSIAGGYKAQASGSWNAAIGALSQVNNEAEQSTAVGGYNAVVSANKGTALGSRSNVSAENGIALGYNASVESAYNVSLGATSDDTAGVGGYKDKSEGDLVATASAWDENNEWLWGQQVEVGDFAGWQANGGTVSVGYKGFERTITNVAAGRISADSTDAINGSQVYQVAGNLQTQIDGIKVDVEELKNSDHYHTVNGNDKETNSDSNTDSTVDDNTATNGNTDNVSGNETGGVVNNGQTENIASDGDVTGGTNTAPVGDKPDLGGGYVPEGGDGNLLIKWDTDENGKKYYDISLNKDLNIDNVNVTNKITVGDNVSITNDGMTIGDVNISKDEINVGNKVSITDNSVNVGDITINENNIDMNNNKIVNVAEGTDGTDAVNVNQLNKLEQNVTNQFNNLNGKVNRLDDKVNKVGAGAAALAALHPLDFDPDDKLSFSAGVGHYEDATAAAIGAFYQPNDDTLFSLGGTVGNGEEMVNMGVSFRFGQSSNQSRSKKAMAKEIIELRTEVAELKAMVYSLTNQRFDIYKSAIFPDTPENHWAYDYVAAVAGNGILEGYPSGNFDGSRPMTRYEMAAVVYRLMTQGIQVDQRMIDEFAPELARVKVDTLTHYSDGTPHIQRVRVIEGRG